MLTHVLLVALVASTEGAFVATLIPRHAWFRSSVLLVSALGLGAAFAHAHGVMVGMVYAMTSFLVGFAGVIYSSSEMTERRRRNRAYRINH